MDVMEKLVDVHGKLMGLLQRAPYIRCEDVHRQYAVNWLMNNGVTVQEWISVRERLPEDNERVLVYHDDGVIRFGINKGGFADVVSSLYLTHNHRTCFSKVTHWMPLPPAPKGE